MMSLPEPGYTPANLRALLREVGWTRERAAQTLGVRARAVHRWCVDTDNPNHRDMSLDHWRRLLAAAAQIVKPSSPPSIGAAE